MLHRLGTPLLVLLASSAFAHKGPSVAQIQARARGAMVTIETTTYAGKFSSAGFFFGSDNTVVTSYRGARGALKIVVRSAGGKAWIPSGLSGIGLADVVVLHLSQPTGVRPLQAGSGTKVGARVFLVGRTAGSIAAGAVTSKRRIQNIPVIRITTAVTAQNTGSPILDDHGAVIGMASQSYTDQERQSCAVATEMLKAARSAPRYTMGALYQAVRTLAAQEDQRVFLGACLGYSSRVLEAYDRWQIVISDQVNDKGGVADEDVESAYDDLLAEIQNKNYLDLLEIYAILADKPSLSQKIVEDGKALVRVTGDAQRSHRDLVRRMREKLSTDDASKRAAEDRNRARNLLFHLSDEALQSTWDIDVFEVSLERLTTTAKGARMLLTYHALIDPDLKGTRIHRVFAESKFREGDDVIGARLKGGEWVKIESWDDAWSFVIDHDIEITKDGWSVKVLRDGREEILELAHSD